MAFWGDIITVKTQILIKLKQAKKSVTKGAIIGTLAGGALGYFIGFSGEDDKP